MTGRAIAGEATGGAGDAADGEEGAATAATATAKATATTEAGGGGGEAGDGGWETGALTTGTTVGRRGRVETEADNEMKVDESPGSL